MHYSYLLLLCFSIAGLLYFDFSKKAVLGAKSSIVAIGISVVFLLSCDAFGISQHIFSSNQKFLSGFYVVSQNLPFEELLLLFLITYLALLLSEYLKKS
jgi:lycopene cyclase domain-containing protein